MSEHIKSFRGQAASDHKAKMGRMGLARGGEADRKSDEKLIRTALREHDDQMHGGKHTKLKFRADGGATEGDSAKPRNDRKSSKNKGSRGAHVNVIVAPQVQPHPPMPMGAMPMPPIHPAGPAAPPPAPPPPPMMGGAPGLPGGMPPRPGMPMPAPGGIPPRAAGGRVNRASGGKVMEITTRNLGRQEQEPRDNHSTEESRRKEKMGPYNRKSGGGIGDLEDRKPTGIGIGEVGAGGGLGRLKKVAAYGVEAEKGEGSLKK